MSITSIRIPDDLEHSLEALARETHHSKGWIINEALRSYIEHQALENQRWEDTLEALEDIRMGRVVEGDKVHAWLRSWGSKKELSAPKK